MCELRRISLRFLSILHVRKWLSLPALHPHPQSQPPLPPHPHNKDTWRPSPAVTLQHHAEHIARRLHHTPLSPTHPPTHPTHEDTTPPRPTPSPLPTALAPLYSPFLIRTLPPSPQHPCMPPRARARLHASALTECLSPPHACTAPHHPPLPQFNKSHSNRCYLLTPAIPRWQARCTRGAQCAGTASYRACSPLPSASSTVPGCESLTPYSECVPFSSTDPVNGYCMVSLRPFLDLHGCDSHVIAGCAPRGPLCQPAACVCPLSLL